MGRRLTAGLVLAAGSGTRYGRPKALVEGPDGPWVVHAARILAEGGCDSVSVTVGADARGVLALLPRDVTAVSVPDVSQGMSASLRAGLAAVRRAGATQVAVTLVDLPDLTSDVVARLLAVTPRTSTQILARAAFDGVPGHPVLIGRDHFAGVGAAAVGDRGARDYLAAHKVTLVECGDLATGQDVDHPIT